MPIRIALVFLRNEAGGHAADTSKPWQPSPTMNRTSNTYRNCSATVDDPRIGLCRARSSNASAPWIKAANARESGRMCRKSSWLRSLLFATQEQGRKRGRKRERVEGRDRDGECNRQRKLPVKNASRPREERHRHKHRNQDQRRGNDGARDLAHGARCGLVRIRVLHGNMPLHVFDDHDCIVDHQSRGQRDSEQRERVDGETEDFR